MTDDFNLWPVAQRYRTPAPEEEPAPAICACGSRHEGPVAWCKFERSQPKVEDDE